MKRFLPVAWVIAASLFAAVFAAAGGAWAQSLEPAVPPAAQGEKCIRDADFMRRNHPALLKHKRDMTVHDGARTADASLNECITCHAVKGDDGQAVKVSDPRHFCRACHDFAAVKVDCFECHASRPEQAAGAAMSAPDPKETAALAEFVKEAAQ